MSYASIEEAWGVTTFSSGTTLTTPVTTPQDPTPVPAKDPWKVEDAVSKQESSIRKQQYVRAYIDEVYERKGLMGVLGLVNRRIMNDLRAATFMNPSWMKMDQVLTVLLGLFALVVVLDIIK